MSPASASNSRSVSRLDLTISDLTSGKHSTKISTQPGYRTHAQNRNSKDTETKSNTRKEPGRSTHGDSHVTTASRQPTLSACVTDAAFNNFLGPLWGLSLSTIRFVKRNIVFN
jgi:hypothetical protein